MATVTRRTKSKPIPEGAVIRLADGKKFAHWTDANGRAKKAILTREGTKISLRLSTYSIRYRDENGLLRWQSSGTRDKDAAKQIANQLETRASQIRQGLISPAEILFAKAARRPLEEHLAEYVGNLRHKDNTDKHVRLTQQRIRYLIEAGKITAISGLTESAVRAAIDRLRIAPESRGRLSLGLGTLNGYLRAVIGFANWLHKDRRTPHRPLFGLGLFNAETDRRHERRTMSVEELRWLFAVTQSRTLPQHRTTGRVRSLCYLLAAATGYRAAELKSLTTDCFDLDSDVPSVAVKAAHSKRRRAERQPIPPAVLVKLRPWIESIEGGRRVFATIAGDTARMLRSDLKASRAAWLAASPSDEERSLREQTDFLFYEDRTGEKADFHSLRMDYVTLLSMTDTDLKTLQTLARHSTPVLTMNTYNRRSQKQLAAPVEQLGEMLMGPLPGSPAGSSGDYSSDYSRQAPGGKAWQDAASSPSDRPQAKEKPTNKKTPAKAAVVGTSQGSLEERLRSESNRRWRICNPLP